MTSNLVDWLETRYPNQLPIRQTSDYELGVLIGQRIVVEEIKLKYKKELDKHDEHTK